jgi:hypothetical protein
VVGDDVQVVLVPAAGRADVEPAVAGGLRDKQDGDVDGIALGAVFGGGEPQSDVLVGVHDRQCHGCVSGAVGHGQ